jgi:membrane-bound lytic murein transglycosylase D
MSNVEMRFVLIPFFALSVVSAYAEPTTSPSESDDDLYKVGQQLFDQYATPEIKEQYAFPSKDDWDRFAARLQQALGNDSLENLAAYEPEAQAALNALRLFPDNDDYADWLELRIDEIEAAKQAVAASRLPTPSAPGVSGPSVPIPHYDLWLRRERGRPMPAVARALMPRLRNAFIAEGVPAELAWIAEVESNLNPSARSPTGAKGLFQLMPETAHSLGLGTILPDERADPEKSARAAARYLHMLFEKFGSWPLALAAYNSGEGRVSRLLAGRKAADFAGIASGLPAETRMYVPKVCALVAVRTGMVL